MYLWEHFLLSGVICINQIKRSHFQPQSLHCRTVGEPCSCPPAPASYSEAWSMDSGSYYQPASKDVQISFSKYPGIFFHVWKLEKYTFLLELWSADVWFPPCEEACAHLSRASPSPPRQMRPSPVRRCSKVPRMALDSQTFLSQFFFQHEITKSA